VTPLTVHNNFGSLPYWTVYRHVSHCLMLITGPVLSPSGRETITQVNSEVVVVNVSMSLVSLLKSPLLSISQTFAADSH